MSDSSTFSSDVLFKSLAEKLRKGDRKAVEKIWLAYGSDLRRRARTRLRQFGMVGHTESMDICNAVLLDLVRQREVNIKNPGDLMKYVRRAIDNQVRDVFKLLTRDRRDIRRNDKVPVESHDPLGNQSSPSQVMIRDEIFDRVVKNLGEDGQTLFDLVLKRYSWPEIAQKMNAKPDTLRIRWYRALQKTQQRMLPEEGSPNEPT